MIEISIHALLAESDPQHKLISMLNSPFLSTLSLRRATWVLMGGLSCDGNFYPRSPCGERLLKILLHCFLITISIHALLAESDDDLEPSKTRRLTFLSTLSLRRATASDSLSDTSDVISIHALLAESDRISAR